MAEHSVDCWLTTEILPMPDNPIIADKEGHVHLAYKSTDDKKSGGLYDELRKTFNQVGLAQHHVLDTNLDICLDIPVAGDAYRAGTRCFGTHPPTSVLDVNTKADGLDNLHVVGTRVRS